MIEKLHLFEDEDPARMRPSEFEHTFCSPRGQDLLLLMHAVQIVSGKHSIARERLHTARRILSNMMQVICPDGSNKLEELVSGHDLKTLGIPQGPHYRELKNRIRDAQLTHKISTKNQAIELVKDWMHEDV